MPTRYAVWLVVLLALLAGCTTSAQAPEKPTRNATLSLPDYEHAGSAPSVETRVFWDRSKSWEDPGTRNATVVSRANVYRNRSGTDRVVVYTTPDKPYAEADRVRSLSAVDLADLATRPVDLPPPGNASGPPYDASLFGRPATVREVTDAGGTTTAHVAHVVHSGVVVVVVVDGGADRATVERVLHGVRI